METPTAPMDSQGPPTPDSQQDKELDPSTLAAQLKDILLSDDDAATLPDRAERASARLEEAFRADVPPKALLDSLATRMFGGDSPDSLELLSFVAFSFRGGALLSAAARAIREASSSSRASDATSLPEKLRKVLVRHMAVSPSAQVSDDAGATLAACAKHRTNAAPAVDAILDDVNEMWENNRRKSVTAVRCATCFVDVVVGTAVPNRSDSVAASLNLLDSLLNEESSEDPLLRLSVLDLLERWGQERNNLTPWMCRYLTSRSIASTVLALAGVDRNQMQMDTGASGDIDPLLGGSALRLLAVLMRCWRQAKASEQADASAMETEEAEELSLEDAFVRALRNFTSSSLSEADRLALLQAMASLCVSSRGGFETVLRDDDLSDVFTVRGSQPPLQAATLHSAAEVLENSSEKDLVLQLYYRIGGSDFIFTKCLKSCPFPEVRLAAYRLWTAVDVSVLLKDEILEWLVTERDPDADGRVARHALLDSILQASRGRVSAEVTLKLQKRVDQGAHYRAVQSWDVATE